MRRLLAALALAAFAGPILSAAEPGPQATVQVKPVGKILADIRAASMLVAGDDGPAAVDRGLKEALGDDGFSGLDLTKPLLGYTIFDEKDANKTAIVLLVPITKESEFLDLLKRGHLEPATVIGAKGLYTFGKFDLPQDNKPLTSEVLMRIVGSTAYFGFNAKPEDLDPAKAFKAEQIFDAKETALFAYKQFNDRIPPEVLKANLKSMDESLKRVRETIGNEDNAWSQLVMAPLEKLAKSMIAISFDAKESGARVFLDPESGEFAADIYFTPRPDTLFAKVLAARPASTNAFAALVNDTTALGLTLQMPVGMKEVQDLVAVSLEKWQKDIKAEPYAKELSDEFFKGLIRTVKSGTWEYGQALNGPDKDGHFNTFSAMTFEDALPLEKALKAGIKDYPAPWREGLKFDVEKIGDINVHTFTPPENGDDLGQLFGDRKIYIAFGPKGIYGTMGNDALSVLKTAITAKPAPANAFDILLNPKRLGQAIAGATPNGGPQVDKILGSEDKTLSMLAFSVSGGESLRIKFSMNLKGLPRIGYNAYKAFTGR